VTTFEEFYEDTIDTVTSYVLRRCDSSGAQDVISETYVIAWRKHAHTAPKPIGYLLLTARRVLDRTRRGQASRQVTAERLYRLMSHSGPSAEDVALRRREIADARRQPHDGPVTLTARRVGVLGAHELQVPIVHLVGEPGLQRVETPGGHGTRRNASSAAARAPSPSAATPW